MQKIKYYWPLAVIVMVAGVLRAYNLSHGVGIHPDERHMIMVADTLNLHNLNPKSFAYGSFPYYLLWLCSRAAGVFESSLTTYDGLFLVGRAISVFFGLAGIVATFFLTEALFRNRAASYLAALLIAFNVFHLQLSRFYTVDVIMTTLTTGALLSMVALAREGTLKSYLLSGFLLGLALATKITALFLLCPLGVAIAINIFEGRKWFEPKVPLYVLASLGLAVFTFALVEPYALLDFNTFISHNREQTGMVQGLWRPPYTIQYEHTAPYFYHLKQMLLYTMGGPVALAVLIGVLDALVRLFRRFSNAELVALAYLLPPFLLISQFQVKFPRYMLPFYPVLLCFAAYTLASLGQGRLQRALEGGPDQGVVPPAPGSFYVFSRLSPFFENFSAFLQRRRRLIGYSMVVLAAGFIAAEVLRLFFFRVPPTLFEGCRGKSAGCYDHMMDLAVSRGGSIYAVDMYNARVQRYDSLGNFVSTWGKKGSGQGKFEEPRGIDVDEDGNVFVMDTWNSRVQKFTADGNFIREYRVDPSFLGAKGVKAAGGKIYVADSGNGRVVVLDGDDGNTAFIGEKGKGTGQLWEPSSVTAAPDGSVFVLDSGNNRIQHFDPQGGFLSAWPIEGWTGEGLKEGFIELTTNGDLCLADPVGGRLLCFKPGGEPFTVSNELRGVCGLAIRGNTALAGIRFEGRVQELPIN